MTSLWSWGSFRIIDTMLDYTHNLATKLGQCNPGRNCRGTADYVEPSYYSPTRPLAEHPSLRSALLYYLERRRKLVALCHEDGWYDR